MLHSSTIFRSARRMAARKAWAARPVVVEWRQGAAGAEGADIDEQIDELCE